MLEDLLNRQHGVVAQWQLLACGLSRDTVRVRVAAARWQRLYRGVSATFTGPIPRLALLWAAVLRTSVPAAGIEVAGSALSFATAAELEGIADSPSGRRWMERSQGRRWIHVTVPRYRRVDDIEPSGFIPGIKIHHSNRFDETVHPVRLPPRIRLEETALDLAAASTSLDESMAWLARPCQYRLTTPDRLLSALESRPRSKWRAEFTAALSDVDEGAHTLLELRFVRLVERPHGLPPGQRQFKAERTGDDGRKIIFYEDIRYDPYGIVVELDGRIAHPDDRRWRDMNRDNATVRAGMAPLRYGWGDVTETPCAVAADLAEILSSRGWQGTPIACSPTCRVGWKVESYR